MKDKLQNKRMSEELVQHLEIAVDYIDLSGQYGDKTYTHQLLPGLAVLITPETDPLELAQHLIDLENEKRIRMEIARHNEKNAEELAAFLQSQRWR